MNLRIYLPLFFLYLFSSLTAQQTKEISHYLFPEFTKGSVLMKGGRVNPALLNYNAATEEMVFDQNGQVLALADPSLSQIDTVFIKDRQFVVLNKKFAEVLLKGDDKLLAFYKCKVIPPGKPAGYGGTSQTSSVDSYSSYSIGGLMYDLKLPDDFKVEPYTVYLLKNSKGKKEIKSMRQLRNHYKKKKDVYDQYVRENKVNFEDQQAVAQLVSFMEDLQ